MGKRTSIYLTDDLAEAVKRSGVPLAELVRRGLDGAPAPAAAGFYARGGSQEPPEPAPAPAPAPASPVPEPEPARPPMAATAPPGCPPDIWCADHLSWHREGEDQDLS